MRHLSRSDLLPLRATNGADVCHLLDSWLAGWFAMVRRLVDGQSMIDSLMRIMGNIDSDDATAIASLLVALPVPDRHTHTHL